MAAMSDSRMQTPLMIHKVTPIAGSVGLVLKVIEEFELKLVLL